MKGMTQRKEENPHLISFKTSTRLLDGPLLANVRLLNASMSNEKSTKL